MAGVNGGRGENGIWVWMKQPTRSSGPGPPRRRAAGMGAMTSVSVMPPFDATRHGAAIPPRKDACIWQHANTKAPPRLRDTNLRQIRHMGRKVWKRHSGYHRRSLAETAVFRFETIFGERLQTRTIENPVQRNAPQMCRSQSDDTSWPA